MRVRWRTLLKCPTCGAPCGKPCKGVVRTRYAGKGEPLARPHPDRPRSAWQKPRLPGCKGDPELLADRLITWKRLAQRGVPVDDIAHQLGMKRASLDQLVGRARLDGHPDAVYHLDALLRNAVPPRRRTVPARV